MKKLGLISLTVALLIGICSFAALADGTAPHAGTPGPAACQHRGPGFAGSHRGPAAFWAALKLTAEQQDKLLELRQNFEKDSQSIRFDLQKKQLQLRRLWAEKPLNAEAIGALDQQITVLQVQLVNMSRDLFQQMRSVLTPEQQKLVAQGLKKFHFPGRGRNHFRKSNPNQPSRNDSAQNDSSPDDSAQTN